MSDFTFDGNRKKFLYGMMAVGVVCLILTFLTDHTPGHMRFWSNFLHNSAYFTGISFISLFFLTAAITAWGGWYVAFKRVVEAFTLFLPVGLVLMLIVAAGIWGHFHHLYHWADPEAVATDEVLQHKSAFLNKGWFTFGTLIFVGIWYWVARKLRMLSLEEDEKGGPLNFTFHKEMRKYSAGFLLFAAFSSAALIWLWLMSIDAHWYSTMYAWYMTASWFVGATALMILVLIWLRSKGYMPWLNDDHLHDMGKFLFAFSIFWTYLWYDQYMLIWYGNIGEETIYFKERLDNYPVLFYGNLVLNFVLPFLVLMPNTAKRKMGTLMLVSVLVFFGHWWDYFQAIKPGALINAQHLAHAAEEAGHAAEHGSSFMMGFTIPGLLELGTLIGFLGLFLYVVMSQLEKAPLLPKNDPYKEESLHHHVWPFG